MEAGTIQVRLPLHGPLVRRLAGDQTLVSRVRTGDDRAFEAIFDRYHRPLLSFCRHMLGNREESEDALQQTFLCAYRSLVSSDRAIQLRPWLYTIARNQCVTMLRARRQNTALDDAEPATDGLSAQVQQREEIRTVLVDLSRLPDDQRAALVLAELGSLSHAEIAEALGCPREKVKALVFQARRSLGDSRVAREMPCAEVREQLATLSGGALRRAPLRGHLRQCAACREFRAKVRGQRRAIAILLPVVPTAGLRKGVLAGFGLNSGGGAVIGSAGLGTCGGSAAKLVVAGLAAVGAGTGGALVVKSQLGRAAPPSPASRPVVYRPEWTANGPARHVRLRLAAAGNASGSPESGDRTTHATALAGWTASAGNPPADSGSTGQDADVAALAGPAARTDSGELVGPSANRVVSPTDPAADSLSHSDATPVEASSPLGVSRDLPDLPGVAPGLSGETPRRWPGDRLTVGGDAGQAGAGHGQAGEVHGQADEVHGQADEVHGQADEVHGQASEIHGQAGEVHGQVGDEKGVGNDNGSGDNPGPGGPRIDNGPMGQRGDNAPGGDHEGGDDDHGQTVSEHGQGADDDHGHGDDDHGEGGGDHGHGGSGHGQRDNNHG